MIYKPFRWDEPTLCSEPRKNVIHLRAGPHKLGRRADRSQKIKTWVGVFTFALWTVLEGPDCSAKMVVSLLASLPQGFIKSSQRTKRAAVARNKP